MCMCVCARTHMRTCVQICVYMGIRVITVFNLGFLNETRLSTEAGQVTNGYTTGE